MMQLPAPLARAFEEKVTITAGELCRLLPIDRKTLHRHIRAGHIAWVQLGMGDRAVRRGFTLKAVMRFLEDRERIMSTTGATAYRKRRPKADGILARQARMAALKGGSNNPNDILVLQARLVAEREARKSAS